MASESDIFHTAFYINLDRSPDRREHMEKTFGSRFETLKRIQAVDGNQLQDTDLITKYEVACTTSHINAIKDAYDSGLKDAIIMEDDMQIDYIDKWENTIPEIVKNAPEDVECIQLHCINGAIIERLSRSDGLFHPWIEDHWSTGCYYINRKGMEKLLKCDKPYRQADIYLYENVKTYTYARPTFTHKMAGSTIHNDHYQTHKSALDAITTFFSTESNDSESTLFHSVYYINLDRAPERKEHMEKTFQKHFGCLKRITAVDGNTLNDTNITKYELACVMSHIKAITQAYNDGLDSVLIMEDDMRIDYLDKWEKSIRKIISLAPHDAECLQLHSINNNAITAMINMEDVFCKWQHGSSSCGCYYINRSGMEKIMNCKDSIAEADNYIYRNVVSYTYTRPLFNHIAGDTSIHITDRDQHMIWHQQAQQTIDNYFSSPQFHTAYYINLDRCPQRREKMEKNIRPLLNNLIRVTAVDGNALPESLLSNTTGLSKYELACTLSHLKAIKQAYDAGLNDVLIMEDDIYCNYIDKWVLPIKTIISNIPRDAECIQLQCSHEPVINNMLTMDPMFTPYPVDSHSAGCYYLTRRGMYKAIKLEGKYTWSEHQIFSETLKHTHIPDHCLIMKHSKQPYTYTIKKNIC